MGSHLAEKLLAKDQEVFVVDNLSTGSLENIKHLQGNKNFHFIKGSVLDKRLLAETIRNVEQIYHLAAVVGVKKILGKPLESLLTNIKGTEIVLEEAEQKGAKVLITSSSEVCGKGDNLPFREDDDRTYGSVYNDRWVYAFSKAVDEFLALAYWREKKLPVVVVRLFNVIGPRQTGFYGMVVPTLVSQALAGENLTIFGDGKQTRCFADVEDITSALIRVMEAEKAEGQVLNIGSAQEISIEALAQKIKELTESRSTLVYIPYKDAYAEGYEDFRRRVPDITKVKQLINYESKISLEESIRRIIEYKKSS